MIFSVVRCPVQKYLGELGLLGDKYITMSHTAHDI
jgi:hypothetical protein